MWVLLITLSGFFDAVKAALGKKILKTIDVEVLVAGQFVFASIFLFPFFIFNQPASVGKSFFFLLLLNNALGFIGTYFYWKSIQSSELSLMVPLSSTTPLFLLISSPLITHETPPITGMAGVLTVIAGVYLLNLNELIRGKAKPLTSLVENKSTRYIFISLLLWSITTNLDKIESKSSSPIFYVFLLSISFAVFFLFLVLIHRKFHLLIRHIRFLALNGILISLILILQMEALTMAIVPYVITLKGVSILFGVVFGYFLFQERGIKHKFVGALVILSGIFIILMSSFK